MLSHSRVRFFLYAGEIGKLAKSLGNKMTSFDADDRSARFVLNAFDPCAKVATEVSENIAIAISDYRSEEEKDLTFQRGDRIKITLQHNSGWWEGELDGKKGYFPKSFVQVAGTVESKNESIGAVFLCVQNFESSRSSEIDLLTGDLVYVDFIVRRKCSGTNLRTQKKGMFPLSHLERTMQESDT